MVYELNDIERIYSVGSVQGEFKKLFEKISSYLPMKMDDSKTEEKGDAPHIEHSHPFKLKRKGGDSFTNSLIVVCGDCGFGFRQINHYIKNIEKFNELFTKTNTHLYFIRGNHDDPSYFDGKTINFSNVKAIEDYSVVKTKEHGILCVGGAISVDRAWRKSQEMRINRFSKYKKSLVWENEAPIFNREELLSLIKSGLTIDIVMTHSCPSKAFPINEQSSTPWVRADASLQKDIKAERKVMDNIYKMLADNKQEVKLWVYNHFDIDYDKVVKGVNFKSLAMFHFYNIDNFFQMEKVKKQLAEHIASTRANGMESVQTYEVDPHLFENFRVREPLTAPIDAATHHGVAVEEGELAEDEAVYHEINELFVDNDRVEADEPRLVGNYDRRNIFDFNIPPHGFEALNFEERVEALVDDGGDEAELHPF